MARFTSEGAKPCAPMPSKSMPLVAETLGRTSFCTSGSDFAGLTTPRVPSGIGLGSGASTSPRPSTSMGSSLRGRETAWPVGYLTIVLVLASWANARAAVSARQHTTTAPLQGRNFLLWLTDFLLEESWNRLFPVTEGIRRKLFQSVFEGHHGQITTAKSCNSQKAAGSLRHGHHRSVTIDRVPVRRHVPAPSLVNLLLTGGEGGLCWGRQPGDGKRQDQG